MVPKSALYFYSIIKFAIFENSSNKINMHTNLVSNLNLTETEARSLHCLQTNVKKYSISFVLDVGIYAYCLDEKA